MNRYDAMTPRREMPIVVSAGMVVIGVTLLVVFLLLWVSLAVYSWIVR